MNLILIHHFEDDYSPAQREFPVVYPSIEGLRAGIQMLIDEMPAKYEAYEIEKAAWEIENEKIDRGPLRENARKQIEVLGKLRKNPNDPELKALKQELHDKMAEAMWAAPHRPFPPQSLIKLNDTGIIINNETTIEDFEIFTLEEWFEKTKSTPTFH